MSQVGGDASFIDFAFGIVMSEQRAPEPENAPGKQVVEEFGALLGDGKRVRHENESIKAEGR